MAMVVVPETYSKNTFLYLYFAISFKNFLQQLFPNFDNNTIIQTIEIHYKFINNFKFKLQ